MSDLYLESKLKIQPKKKEKDKFEEAIEKNLDDYIATISIKEENLLESAEMKKKRLKEEMREALSMDWMEPYLILAFDILFNESKQYLDESENQLIVDQFSKISDKLNQLDLSTSFKNYQSYLNISNDSMEAVWKIALAKYVAGEYKKCTALFVLLAALASDESEYWLRMGISAQEDGDFQLALRAYLATLSLDPNHLGARLMAIECFLATDQLASAEAEYLEAQKIVENADKNEIDPISIELLNKIEEVIKNYK